MRQSTHLKAYQRCHQHSKYLFIASLLVLSPLLSAKDNKMADSKYPVGISATQPYVDVMHQGTKVRVHRIQDTSNKLIDDFAKTSRPCPPFCIHPMQSAPGVTTVGEIELFAFIQNQVANDKGLLVDARMPKFYESETIPGSINIPFILFTSSTKELFPLLNVKTTDQNKFDFSQAKELLLFCNGPWCDQSPRAINGLIKAGYPAEKLSYYRGGMTLWKLFSLTTVQPVSNEVAK